MAPAAYQAGSPASRRSTPSRNTPNGVRRVNGHHSPFRDGINGSPSRPSLEDFGRVYASEQRALKRSLDDQTSEQQAKHIRALDYGLKEHQRVRESAERELEYIILENEREQRRRAELEAQRIEETRKKLEQQKEDEQRRRVEEVQARQEEERRREKLRKQEEDDAQKRAAEQQQRDQEEKARKEQKEKEDADRRARGEAEAKIRDQEAQKERENAAQRASASSLQANGVAASGPAAASSSSQLLDAQGLPAGLVSPRDELEATHRKYIDLHQRLKKMRKEVSDHVKALGKEQKAQLTDWRHAINRAIGMLRKQDDPETKRSNQDKVSIVSKMSPVQFY